MEINNHYLDQFLVEGGAGFISQSVVKKSLKQGLDLTVKSKNSFSSTVRSFTTSCLTVDNIYTASLLVKLENKVLDYVVNLDANGHCSR